MVQVEEETVWLNRQQMVRSDIHDRFLIIDDTVYHLGASLKDLGKKLFAFSKMGIPPGIIFV